MDNSQIFRKESIDRISSPEQMNGYIKIANPGSMILLGIVLFFVIAGFVWAIFARVETTISGICVNKNNEHIIYVSEADGEKVSVGATIFIGNSEILVEEVGVDSLPVKAEDALDEYYCHMMGYDVDTWVYPIKYRGDIPSETDRCELIIEKKSPISFLGD